jgi:ABC-2 type transport system ATP-binding protein
VLITVDISAAETLSNGLTEIDSVHLVERLDANGATARLRVNAREARPIITEVADFVKSRNIPVSELSVERGRLDDIFRQITSGKGTEGTTDA